MSLLRGDIIEVVEELLEESKDFRTLEVQREYEQYLNKLKIKNESTNMLPFKRINILVKGNYPDYPDIIPTALRGKSYLVMPSLAMLDKPKLDYGGELLPKDT